MSEIAQNHQKLSKKSQLKELGNLVFLVKNIIKITTPKQVDVNFLIKSKIRILCVLKLRMF